VWKGIRRELGTAPRRAQPLIVEELRQLCAQREPARIGRRSCAAQDRLRAALRRSELVALKCRRGAIHGGWDRAPHPKEQDRSRSRRRAHRCSARFRSSDVPRVLAARMARGCRERRRCDLRFDHAPLTAPRSARIHGDRVPSTVISGARRAPWITSITSVAPVNG
jgi:hypothetical protein